jgi:hypothetical protein
MELASDAVPSTLLTSYSKLLTPAFRNDRANFAIASATYELASSTMSGIM